MYLSLLEGLPCKVTSTGSLEQGQVTSGLLIPLLLQLRQSASSEEQLQQETIYNKHILAKEKGTGEIIWCLF